MNDSKLMNRAADNIRILAASMVEKANSGHPGGAMGGADFVNVLFSEFLVYDPQNPRWEGRDRFFLDPGHMSPMLYSVLAFTGKYTLDELKQFRQWGSPTPGHPEVNVDRGVENTSGPLGQGHTYAVGAAIAAKFLKARFGEIMNQTIYAYISDGGIQEEISQGAGRIAGTLGLDNLIMFYDSNDVQLSTNTEDVTTENVAMKYEAWDWKVITINGNDPDEIRKALIEAKAEKSRPTLSNEMSASFLAAKKRSDETLAKLEAKPSSFTMLTGDRPTGRLHLGHYFGSIRERVAMQERGVNTNIIIADYQVITDRDTTEHIQDNVLNLVLDYMAAGIDPNKTMMFTHSAVPAENQLLLPFLSLVTEAELHRNPTVKSEMEASGHALTGLLLTYPVHQACDILFCKANVVPIGKDNLPHVEITRTIARRFNERYAKKNPVFPEPAAILSEAPEIPGLDGRKMSKSYGNSIMLGATAEETAKLIKKSPTDSERRITFDPVARPQVSALLTTAGLVTGRDPKDIAEEIGDSGAGALKAYVIESVNEFLAPHRERRAELAKDMDSIRDILHDGNKRANAIAEETLDQVREAMGMKY